MPWVALEESGVTFNFSSGTGSLSSSVATLPASAWGDSWYVFFPDLLPEDAPIQFRVTPVVYAPPPTEDDRFVLVGEDGFDNVFVTNATPAGPNWSPNPTEMECFVHYEGGTFFRYEGQANSLETQFYIEVLVGGLPTVPCFWGEKDGVSEACDPEA